MAIVSGRGRAASRPRQFPDWIGAFQEYTKVSESPTSFHLWAACSCIAAALQRRCYLPWGYGNVYPNMFNILVGPSGRARKAEPITIARSLVERLQIPLIGEDNSQEAIIQEMKNSVQSFTDRSSRRITFHSSVSCFLEELSVFTGEKNTRFLAYLTNWYDSRDKWKRTTKHQGTDEIIGMCFNMLAATAPDWLPYILPKEAIGGGFTSRCIFIVEDQKGKIVADPNLERPDKEMFRRLALDLEQMVTMSGEFELEPAARDEYTAWYTREEEKIAKGTPTMHDELFAGYSARRPWHVFKLSIIMSTSRGSDYVITQKDFRRAKALLEITEKKMPRVFSGIGRARYAEETDMVLAFLINRRSAVKSEILGQFYRNVDSLTLDIIMRVLSDMRKVRTTIRPGQETLYEYIGTEPILRLVKDE